MAKQPLSDFASLSVPAELTRVSSFARLWRGFMTARVAIAVVLLLLLALQHSLLPALNVSVWLLALCVAYFAAALAVRLFTQPRPPGSSFDPQWVSTIGVDLVAFSTLQFLQAGGINYSPLFALPVLMGSVLGSALLALGTAAGVTLLLLMDAWVLALHAPDETAARFLQAGLTGIGYFALSLLVNQMAERLSREERAARQSLRAARVQTQVNQLVIESLRDGVLVVDSQCRVHAANPAAQAMLGLLHSGERSRFALAGQPRWEPLAELAQLTFGRRQPQVGEIAIPQVADQPRRIHVRTRLTSPDTIHGESLCVMFLDDLRDMEARLRIEKLAAMGRMSAAVAHEIRNPLAAIAQANALMEEDLKEPGLRQLSALVHKNTQRLSQIVDEILNVSRLPSERVSVEPLELDPAVASVCSDWAVQTRSSERLQLALGAPGARVLFEAPHLRRVLVNLLDNALRYAGEQADSIRVATSALDGQVNLVVWSDGAALPPSVEQRLFEPFFSSESRSSGLGLYICRELCERHGATIGYRRRTGGAGRSAREGNEFFVTFGARPLLAGAAPFDTIAA